MKNIYLKDYIKTNRKLKFYDVNFFEFGQADESINVCRAMLDCHKCFEEFVLQCFLVFMNKDLFMKNEELDINTGKLNNLEEFLFKNDWKEEYQLIPISDAKAKSLLFQWIDSKNIKEMNFDILSIKSAFMLGRFNSMNQYLIFTTSYHMYLLVRQLG